MRTISRENVEKLLSDLAVNPENYNKKIRVYCDVDGVIQPFIYREEDLEALDKHIDAEYIEYYLWDDEVKIKEGLFYFRENVQKFLSELSLETDFVWLTAWKMNAPRTLDHQMNIKSLGYLPWEIRRSDYNHYFKRSAIEADQKENPSKFIWLEDMANKNTFSDGQLFKKPIVPKNYSLGDERKYKKLIPKNRYCSINTNSYIGLMDEEIDRVWKWIRKNS